MILKKFLWKQTKLELLKLFQTFYPMLLNLQQKELFSHHFAIPSYLEYNNPRLYSEKLLIDWILRNYLLNCLFQSFLCLIQGSLLLLIMK